MIKILGVKLNNLNEVDVDKKINDCFLQNKSCFFATPNPEIILEAQKNEELFYILNKTDISFPDAFGLKLVGFLLGVNLKRQTGADLTLKLLNLSKEKGYRVLFVIWENGLSSKKDIEKALEKKYPGLKYLIIKTNRKGKGIDWDKINYFKPDIMLVGLGSPWQEKFCYLKKYKIPSLKISVGIGGALDFVSGKIKRAPLFLRKIGLEWLWRLIKQPKRLPRIYRATVVFTLKNLKSKFILPFKYRKNVVCFLYKKEDGKYKVLLLERKDEKNHWQLPQGGKDGEKTKKAALREISEEVGLSENKLSFKVCFKKANKYIFPESKKILNYHFFKKIKEIYSYKGQEQDLCIFEFLGNDNDINIKYWDHSNFKWVDEDELIKIVHEVRKDSAKIFIEKFKKWHD